MAQATDYFLQGTNLGMRATQAAAEADMFRTNLAERTRQFDLSNELARDQFDIQKKRFKLEQESAVLDQKLQKFELEKAETQSNEMKRILNQREQYKPAFDKYHSELINWNGFGEPPQVPSGWPKEIRDEAVQIRGTIQQSALQNQVLQTEQALMLEQTKRWADGLEWMRLNSPKDVRRDPQTGQFTYNENEYYRLRSLAQRRASDIEARKAQAEYRKTLPKTLAQKIEDFASRNAEKFYIQNEDTGKYMFDKKGFQEALSAAVGIGIMNPAINSDDPYADIDPNSLLQ